MKLPQYEFKTEPKMKRYFFTSIGVKGDVLKMVDYTETEVENVYNLGFGDYDETTDSIDDLSVTNNGDSQKVLATVAKTLIAFTEKYPKAKIFATGSTESRIRLYRMGITNHLLEIEENFEIFGYQNISRKWVKFKVGEDYLGFLISKK